MDHRDSGAEGRFDVLGQPAVASEPGEGPLDPPSARSAESWLSQKARSAASASKTGSGSDGSGMDAALLARMSGRLMSRAEITRSNVPPARRVKVTGSRRPASVWPSAWKRGSPRLWVVSAATTKGSVKNTCSTSAHRVLVGALAGVAFVPFEADDPIEREHAGILSS